MPSEVLKQQVKLWTPQRGPQFEALLADFADEIFFGGERGGGKSDFQLGYQQYGAFRYGTNWHGIMFRKTYPEMEELQGRAMQIFGDSGGTFKSQQSAGFPFSNCWYWDSGASVKMRYIENEKDYGRYHGHQYCVGVDTPILMADSTYKPIRRVFPGEEVWTLEGPRRVLATVRPYLAPCVRLTTQLGSQIQPIWHPVLTSVEGNCELRSDAFRTFAPPLPQNEPWQSAESLLCADRTSKAAGASSVNGQSDCKASEDEPQGLQPHQALIFPVVLLKPLHLKAADQKSTPPHFQHISSGLFAGIYREWISSFPAELRRLRECVGPAQDRVMIAGGAFLDALDAYVRPDPDEVRDLNRRCGIDYRRGDARPRLDREIDRSGVPSLVDVGELSRAGYRMDERDYIPGDTRPELYKYIHPYTKERRPGFAPVELGTGNICFHGDALVCDLTIEGANHYVTKCGAINKNTGISFDEVTEYPTPTGLLKMLSTLRSAVGVPCTVRLTGNPGGVGHIWVKSRYIDNSPPLTPYKDPETGFTRMFIPSKLSDNAILLQNDPLYRNRIRAATGGNEALRKAWLEGDWNIVAGAFFDCWSPKMILHPFAIPEEWTRFRSGDWGSARPYSFGWWAVVQETYELPDGQILSRGAIVRYREIYGAKDRINQPNIGTKEDAESIGERIAALEKNEKVSYGVFDPAAFASDGGPSIAERLYRGSGNKVIFRKADNARVGLRGAMGGWDQMRARMKGEDGRPMVYCFSTCIDSIRTIPLLQHDPNRLEDIWTESEDHAGDDWRYACMSRPYRAQIEDKPAPRFLHEASADEIFWPDGRGKSAQANRRI